MTNKKPQFNPLHRLWNIIGTIGGIISLSSMVQDWFSNIILWKGFIASITNSYRSILEPVMDFVFSWLPFHVPYFWGDYFVFGSIYAAARSNASIDMLYNASTLYRKLYIASGILFKQEDPDYTKGLAFLHPSNRSFKLFFVSAFWPIIWAVDLFYLVRPYKLLDESGAEEDQELLELIQLSNEMEMRDRAKNKVSSMQIQLWASSYLLGLLVLLSINLVL